MFQNHYVRSTWTEILLDLEDRSGLVSRLQITGKTHTPITYRDVGLTSSPSAVRARIARNYGRLKLARVGDNRDTLLGAPSLGLQRRSRGYSPRLFWNPLSPRLNHFLQLILYYSFFYWSSYHVPSRSHPNTLRANPIEKSWPVSHPLNPTLR